MCRQVVWQKVTNASEQHGASIFRVLYNLKGGIKHFLRHVRPELTTSHPKIQYRYLPTLREHAASIFRVLYKVKGGIKMFPLARPTRLDVVTSKNSVIFISTALENLTWLELAQSSVLCENSAVIFFQICAPQQGGFILPNVFDPTSRDVCLGVPT
jgi:hypothetical protein